MEDIKDFLDGSEKGIPNLVFAWGDQIAVYSIRRYDSLELFKWITKSVRTERYLMERGSVDMLAHMRDIGFHFPPNSFLRAAKADRFDNFRFLCDNSIVKPDDVHIVSHFVDMQNIEALRYLSKWKVWKWSSDADPLIAAVHTGNVDVVKLIHEMGCPIDQCVVSHACQGGNMEILRYLSQRTDHTRFTVEAFHSAIRGRKVEVLKALTDGSLVAWPFISAEIHGWPRVDQFEPEITVPWCNYVTEHAAMRTESSFLVALRDGSLGSKCPWVKERCLQFARTEDLRNIIISGVLD